MKNISKFIKESKNTGDRRYSEHIDYFINKEIFDYNDCLLVMRTIRRELDGLGLNAIKIMIEIQCGESSKIQNWGEQFWQLVDDCLVPPELFIGEGLSISSDIYRQAIHIDNQENVENYIVFYPNEDKYARCLTIIEKEVPYV